MQYVGTNGQWRHRKMALLFTSERAHLCFYMPHQVPATLRTCTTISQQPAQYHNQSFFLIARCIYCVNFIILGGRRSVTWNMLDVGCLKTGSYWIHSHLGNVDHLGSSSYGSACILDPPIWTWKGIGPKDEWEAAWGC